MKISDYTINNLIKLISIYLNETEESSRERLKEYLDFLDALEVIYDELPDTQVHHIIPRCLYNYSASDEAKEITDESFLNSWDSGNLVRVTIYDHIKCHELLYKATGLGKLAHALGFVTQYNKDYLDSEVPAEFAQELHDKRRELFVSNVTSEVSKLKRSETNTRKYGTSNGAMLTPEAKEKARMTKILRYGAFQPNSVSRTAIDNSHLPEANAKRKATIEARYGNFKPWHSHESARKKAEKLGIRILKISPVDGSIKEELISKREAVRLYGSQIHRALWKGEVYLGYYWVVKTNYNDWYENFKKLSSTTIETSNDGVEYTIDSNSGRAEQLHGTEDIV